MPTPSLSNISQRVQLTSELDHLTEQDARACGISQPTFLGVAVRHGRASARTALLGLNPRDRLYPETPPKTAAAAAAERRAGKRGAR